MQIEYRNEYVILGNDIDGAWCGPKDEPWFRQKCVMNRDQLIEYLSTQFMTDFNRSRGEFDMAVYRVPDRPTGLRIYRRYGYYRDAAERHKLFGCSYMTAGRFTRVEIDRFRAFRFYAFECQYPDPEKKERMVLGVCV